MNGGDLRVARTRTGYVAVLRVQGVEVAGHCTIAEAAALVNDAADPNQVAGFSFAKLARGIGRVASKVARMKALKTLFSVARFLPPPVSTVAHVAEQATKVIAGMSHGEPAALAAWHDAAGRARANPSSPTAVAMRLAMQATGRPVFGRAGAAHAARSDRPADAEAPARAVDAAREPVAELASQIADSLRGGA